MNIRRAVVMASAAMLLSGIALAQTNPSTSAAGPKPGSGSTGGSDTVPRTSAQPGGTTSGATETIEQQKQRAERTNQNAIGSSNPANTPSGGTAGGTTGGSDSMPKKQ